MSRFYDALKQAGKFSDVAEPAPQPVPELVDGAENVSEIAEPETIAETIHGPRAVAEGAARYFPASEASPAVFPTVLNDEPLAEILQDALASAPAHASPALGIPVQTVLDKKARVLLNSANPRLLERYRMITTKILQRRASLAFRSVLVSSASPKDGKTITVVNLGIAFGAMPSFKVLVVDGDLRKGDLSKTLGAGDRPGMSNWLEGAAKLDEVVLQSEELPMKFMLRGNSKVPAAELLQSPQMAKKMKKLAEQFDLVLIDSPPASLLADAQLLASTCDGVLLVARAFSTTCRGFEELCRNLQQFPKIGTILNGGAGAGRYYRRYQYGY